MANFHQFQPDAGLATRTVTATTTSVAYAMPGTGHASDALRTLNSSNQNIYIAFGGSDVVATIPTTDGVTKGSMPLGPGAIEIFTQSNVQTHFAVIVAATTGVLHLTTGQGA